MADQILSIRTQLDHVKDEKKVCDNAILSVSDENHRLQQLCRTEQTRNNDLLSKLKDISSEKINVENKLDS